VVIQTLVERKNVEAKISKGKMSKVEMCKIFKKNKKQNIGRKVVLKDVG
jgi:hypothetical protein